MSDAEHSQQNGGGSPVTQSAGATSEADRFIYLLTHDLQASLRAITSVPGWIEEDLRDAGYDLNSSMEDNMRMLQQHAQRVKQLMEDLMVYTRLGRMQERCNISVKDTLASSEVQTLLPAGFTLDTELALDSFNFGARDIITLFTALISNAVKHHDLAEGRISISTASLNGHAVIRIEDDGPGIPSGKQDDVLKPLVMLKSRDEVEGSGMGLALIKKMTELYGGALAFLNTQTERGTIIELRFPLNPQDVPSPQTTLH